MDENLPLPVVRRAKEKDAPQLLRMIEALSRFHDDIPKASLEALERDVFSAEPWLRVLVAELNSNLVGYSAMCPLVQLQLGARGMDLHHLYVDRAFRGQGIGKTLLVASMETASALFCEYMMVGTDAGNIQAQEFYLSTGFRRNTNKSPRFVVALPKDD